MPCVLYFMFAQTCAEIVAQGGYSNEVCFPVPFFCGTSYFGKAHKLSCLIRSFFGDFKKG
ncbi:hypothetical protein LEP1GSC047_3062 [Leptospira inadai serovar Lyme str. 10]|uniref:Uncharacterized protein n=1 Tax=Leptospira inadai serovar Lyme str. 10 TaxID=1049790 RepID=V6HB65_9LEPT|nr:hypothetical protein LEP1GSC047_3062 [Leptospira inadai serovar Lyme str. 10]